uniref:Pyrimidine-nucleoside phosphorylase n=1 Tax=Streptomyces sp. NRRL 30471 TaxID=996287 RepID=F2WUD8_9ACTN|nr:pyrimidine-nucleoside phosphorylase [Streptomyces sp. NRRL 30471]
MESFMSTSLASEACASHPPHVEAGDVLSAIAAKRDGASLSAQSIECVVRGYTEGRIPDYQMAAWLMAVACRGMNDAETTALTKAYIDSGVRLEFADHRRPLIDKHSTGGVGDKTTLFVAPVVAACGVSVMKISGRGLDFAGGTVDKLESIPGLRIDLDHEQILEVLDRTRMVVVGQNTRLVPADGATYALRDVTGSVESLPLIAASVMSKKIAAGTDGAVIDVKYGSGALVGDIARAEELGRLMIRIGSAFGLPCRVVLSDMGQPLGRAVGNALEVKEALSALRGDQVPGFTELGHVLAVEMLCLAEPGLMRQAAEARVRDAVSSGRALAVFRAWVAGQGGDARVVGNPDLLPTATRVDVVPASWSGWISDVDARAVGKLALRLGAGRLRQEDRVDHAVGVVLRRRVGDEVRQGEPLAEVHWRGDADPEAVSAEATAAFTIDSRPVEPRSGVHSVL